MADERDSKSCTERCVGSSPTTGTRTKSRNATVPGLFIFRYWLDANRLGPCSIEYDIFA